MHFGCLEEVEPLQDRDEGCKGRFHEYGEAVFGETTQSIGMS